MAKISQPRQFLKTLFDAAVEAADPARVIADFLPEKPKGRTIVIGAGKASARMARAFEEAWDGPLEGLVVTRYGFGEPCEKIEIVEAAHPVPDAAGARAAERILEFVSDLDADDLVVALISGGGSALLPAPAGPLTLEDEIAINEALLASGAPISAMNTVRKHFSRIKGGRLAKAAAPAKIVSLLVSDIPGDYPEYIASGPTVPDLGSRQDALKIIQQYQMKIPDIAKQYLDTRDADCPAPDDPEFQHSSHTIIASAAKSLEAAAQAAEQSGVSAVILSDSIEGESRESARTHGAIAREIRAQGRPFKAPVVLLSGGETTVTLRGNGKGGPNTEFLLSLAMELNGIPSVTALCADTDGIDGSEDNAGAFIDGNSLMAIRAKGADPVEMLDNNNAWEAFRLIDGLFVPGPTGTNVNDFRAIFVDEV